MTIDFNDDGTITITLADGDVKLARPTFGQYRQLRNAWRATAEAIAVKAAPLHRRGTDLRDRMEAARDGGDDDAADRLAAEDRQAGGEFTDWQEGQVAAWLVEAITLLSDRDDVDADGLPAAAANVTLPGDMVTWWKSVPLAPGRNRPAATG